MIKAHVGKMMIVTHGEYSAYAIQGLFTVAKEFDPLEERDKYLEMYPEQKEGYKFKREQFLAYLVTLGFLTEQDYFLELNLGDYLGAESVDVLEYENEKP